MSAAPPDPPGPEQEPVPPPAEAAAPPRAADPDDEDDDDEDREFPGVALLVALLAGAVPFCIMAANRRFTWSVPVGGLGVLVSSVALLWAARAFVPRRRPASAPAPAPSDDATPFRDPARVEATPAEVPLRALLSPGVQLTAAVVALVASLRLAVAGSLPAPVLTAGVLVTASTLWCLVALFRAGQTLGAWSDAERPLHRRHGFWLAALTTLLYVPLLGSYSLSDPWETHYGEVAREMLARDDWISLWWAQDGWFWSKPVMNFWMQGLAFSLLGVRWPPDGMLSAAAEGRFPQPEWAARYPVFVLTVLGVYFLYKGVARARGRRAGFLGGVVLLTLPYFYLIAHQTMTDMPYVAPMAAGVGLLGYGLFSDPSERLPTTTLRVGAHRLELHVGHLVLLATALLVLPQVLLLLSRNVELRLVEAPFGFRPHQDEFFSGSGMGNCGLPGNEACRNGLKPVWALAQPAYLAAAWAVLASVLVLSQVRERRVQRWAFMAGWLFVALSAMGKGAPGLVLPVVAVLGYLVIAGRLGTLGRLEWGALVLLVACVVLPWYCTMYARHGSPFTDRLLFHDMYKRAFLHVHDTNAGDDVSFRYYVWQLGYGLFPWVGLAPAALVGWLGEGQREGAPRGGVGALMLAWFLAAFGMFSVTLTKFHHYVLPLVPPTAMLIGIWLEGALWPATAGAAGREDAPASSATSALRPHRLLGWSLLLAGALAGLLAVVCFRGGSLLGTTHGEQWLQAPPRPALGYALGALTVALYAGAAWLLAERGRVTAEPPAVAERLHLGWVGAAAVAGALVIALVGRDLVTTVGGDVEGQARLMHLFTYNYKRPWPEALAFRGALLAFTVMAAGLSLLAVWPRLRGMALRGFLVLSVVWAAWGVDVYLVRASPHWGQRDTLLEYYRRRGSAEETLVAFQMNWKGENFYLGNRVPAFVASGEKFKTWVGDQKKAGKTVLWFTTEHGRTGTLKSELGTVKSFEALTGKRLNNKFTLVRVEL